MLLKCYICWRSEYRGEGDARVEEVTEAENRVVQGALVASTMRWSGWQAEPIKRWTTPHGQKIISMYIDESISSVVGYYELFYCEGPAECFGPDDSQVGQPRERSAPVICVPHTSEYLVARYEECQSSNGVELKE